MISRYRRSKQLRSNGGRNLARTLRRVKRTRSKAVRRAADPEIALRRGKAGYVIA